MAVRAADGPPAGFRGSRSALVNRAQAPNTASQKDEVIQANRMANSTRMAVSRVVKPSTWNTPAIWVTAAAVEASTRNRYSQRRGAMSGTAAGYHGRRQLGGGQNQRREKRAHDAGRCPHQNGLGGHALGAAQRRARVQGGRNFKCARLRIRSEERRVGKECR